MSMLSIKVDFVAALRSIRKSKEPDPAQVVVLSELAGVDGITCHLRQDRLYIRDRDVYILKEMTKTRLTLQIAPAQDLIERALEVKPWRVTLMPFATDEPIIENGIDPESQADLYSETAGSLKAVGINVCYFIDPENDSVKNAARAKANAVELNALDYVNAKSADETKDELERLEQTAQFAAKLGMNVICGGGLNYKNIRPLVEMEIFDGFTVGYAVTSHAILVGYERAVREMAQIVNQSPAG